MHERDPSTAPVLGDRVPYVIIKGMKGAKAFEKAEDPLYVLEKKLSIDAQHYLEHHLSNPVIRLFEAFMPNPQSLLSGDHARYFLFTHSARVCVKLKKNHRHVMIQTPAASGGIMRFVKKTPSCLGCGVPVSSGATVCAGCSHREAEICMGVVTESSAKQAAFSALWTQCQRCQVCLPVLLSIPPVSV